LIFFLLLGHPPATAGGNAKLEDLARDSIQAIAGMKRFKEFCHAGALSPSRGGQGEEFYTF